MSAKRGNRGGFNPFRDAKGRWAAPSSSEKPPTATKPPVHEAFNAALRAQAVAQRATRYEEWKRRHLEGPIPADVPTTAADGRPRDELSRRQFNERYTVQTNDTEEEIARATTRIFGRPVRLQEVARLSGAPDGATVEVRSLSSDTIKLHITHPLYEKTCRRTIRRDPDGPAIHNDLLILREDAPKGFGTRILASQVRAARALGVTQLDLVAGGDADTRQRRGGMNGYYTWPSLGFVGTLDRHIRSHARSSGLALPARATTAHLLASVEGKAWWLKNGETLEMAFDLRDGSYSMDTLNGKLTKNGIVP